MSAHSDGRLNFALNSLVSHIWPVKQQQQISPEQKHIEEVDVPSVKMHKRMTQRGLLI